MTVEVHKSKLEIEKGEKSAKEVFGIAMKRPWILMVREPIVLSLSVYAAIGKRSVPILPRYVNEADTLYTVFGALYLTFTAFLIVFEQQRK
jgi:hypothetical protein